jgi:hypothetical protein
MKIDLGTCQLTFPDDTPLVPVQLMARGVRDEVEAFAMGPLKGAKVQAQGYSRFFTLAIEETPEGLNEQQGLDNASSMVVMGYRGENVEAADYKVAEGLARVIGFKWRGPNSVPLRAKALVHVKGIVARTCFLTWLDTPKATASAEKQFDQIIASVTPAPRIV